MERTQDVNDERGATAQDVNPPDQTSRLGRSYFWTPGQGQGQGDAQNHYVLAGFFLAVPR